MRELFTTICLSGAIQSFILFLVLLIRRDNRIANIHLSLYMIFLAIDMVELYFTARGYIIPRPYQLSIVPYSFVFGPAMFLYITFLTSGLNSSSKKYLLLYIPFMVIFTFNIAGITTTESNQIQRSALIINIITNGGGLVLECVLYAISFIFLNRYIRRLKEFFSAIDTLKLKLIRIMLIILTFVTILIIVSYVSGHNRQQYNTPDIIAILTGLGLVFAIALFALFQPDTFSAIQLINKAVPQGFKPLIPGYHKFRLSEDKEKEIINQITLHMKEKKPYLDEELTLQSLAAQLSLSTHHLSMILNIHFKQNFYNFINRYRIDEVKQRLAEPEFCDHSILNIAFNTGFNSKSTFNAMFKKFTGVTPKEYRKEQLNR